MQCGRARLSFDQDAAFIADSFLDEESDCAKARFLWGDLPEPAARIASLQSMDARDRQDEGRKELWPKLGDDGVRKAA